MATTGFHILEHAGLTDVGVRRSHNQDAFAMTPAGDEEASRERGHLFLVADGMGAHAVGEMASKLAADLIPHTYRKHAGQGAKPAIIRAFEEANGHIHQKGQQNPDFEGMGTTSTAVLIRPEGAWVAHVGDSRAYRIRGGRIEQLSYDHSLHWEIARRQKIRPEQIKGVPNNVIVRSLGPEEKLTTEIEGPHQVCPGDIYLLCSDGLSNQLSDEEIGAIASSLPAAEAARLLVDLANMRGGPDNITVVIVRMAGEYTGNGDDPSAVARRPWRLKLRIPWSGVFLGAGIALAVMALLVTLTLKAPEIALTAFVLAAIVLGVGLFGMYRDYARSQGDEPEPKEPEGPRPPKIHRRTPSVATPALVQRFIDLDAALAQQVRARNWPVPWAAHDGLIAKAAEEAGSDALLSAFRAVCQALAILAEPLRRNRNKGEVFNPNWMGKTRGDRAI